MNQLRIYRYNRSNCCSNLSFYLVVVGLLFLVSTRGQALEEHKRVDFCQVVAAPESFDQKHILIDVVLSPGEHYLLLYAASCVPSEGYNVTTQAILPDSLEATETGRKLSKILRHHREAKVELVGIFESAAGRYGPNAARFRFSISQVRSVAEVRGATSSMNTLPHESGHVDPPKTQ